MILVIVVLAMRLSPVGEPQVWNQPVRVAHETIRQAADRNLWPVPFQPLAIQVGSAC